MISDTAISKLKKIIAELNKYEKALSRFDDKTKSIYTQRAKDIKNIREKRVQFFLDAILSSDRRIWEAYQRLNPPVKSAANRWNEFENQARSIAEEYFKHADHQDNKTLAEELLQKAGVREGLEDYANQITEKAQKLLDLNGGYGSVGVVDIGDSAVKILTKSQLETELDVYELLKWTKSEDNIPKYLDHKANEQIGLMRLGKYPKYPASLERMLRNPTSENRQAYIKETLKAQAQFHADLTRRAKETGKYDKFTTGQGYNTNSNPNLELLTDPLENKRIFSYFKRTKPSKHAIAEAIKIAREVTRIIAEESDCLIHGDWKPENGLIYDFSDVRKGNELEDIMRFMTSYVVGATKQEARDAVNTYINFRSEVDNEFAENKAKHERMRKYADLFYTFKTSLYSLWANKRDLRIPEKKAEREFYVSRLKEAA
ncbi:hypothetical protein KY331_01645 [Candidatus Woesearchaeota archaeon]|nr:hypothetical protein [Candidatus Woesearchaeota archaeon]